MNKNSKDPCRIRCWVRKKTLVMKLCVLFTFLFSFSVVASTHAQQERINLDLKDVSLKTLFGEIQKQTSLSFVYNTELTSDLGVFSVQAKDEMVKDVLQRVLANTGLTYKFEGDIIVIQKTIVKGNEEKSVTVTGKVTDKKKQSIPGVTVQVKGISLGTVTDVNGQYKLTLPNMKEFTLLFTFVGMKSQEVKYVGRDTINVVMESDVLEVDEVVVTGYGNVAKGNYTGASTTVRAEDIMVAGVSTIDQMLQGVIPGMLVWHETGQVGAAPKIRVRGTSTLLGSQEPVWVVDGVIQRNPQTFDSNENLQFSVDADDIKNLAGNAISWLNPNDIETITVLKDASATAIYGSQAANGVIVITTKKATAGRLQVNYNGDFSIGQRPHYGLYDRMNSAERMQLSKEIYEEKRQFASGAITLPIGYEGLVKRLRAKEITLDEMNEEYQRMVHQNTDWFKILFRNSFNHSHNLSISGGSDKIQNRTSFSFAQENGEAKGNSLTHFTVNMNTTADLWNCVSLNLLLNGSIREVNGFAYGVDPFTYAYNTSRVIPCYNEDGSFYYHEKEGMTSAAIENKTTYNYNILNEKANTGSESKTRTWGATFDLKWNVLPGLEYQGLFAYVSSSVDTKEWASERSFYITSIRGYEYGAFLTGAKETESSRLPMGGVLGTGLTNTTTITTRNSLVYDKLFKEKHRLTAQLGIETNSIKTKGETATRYGYYPDRGETFSNPPVSYYNAMFGGETDNSSYAYGERAMVNRLENQLSEYGMLVYAYDDRYVLNLSGRYDASNRFGQDKNKQFQPTWSVGLKWRIAHEPFLDKKWWLNILDIYGSYGYQGNAVSTVSPYLIVTYTNGLQMFDYANGLAIKSYPYPDLGWEKTKTWNIGIDAILLDGRLNFTFDYFRKRSTVLADRAIPRENGSETGIVSGMVMENNGYDLIVNVIPIRNENFTWQLSVNTSVADNTVAESGKGFTIEQYLLAELI